MIPNNKHKVMKGQDAIFIKNYCMSVIIFIDLIFTLRKGQFFQLGQSRTAPYLLAFY